MAGRFIQGSIGLGHRAGARGNSHRGSCWKGSYWKGSYLRGPFAERSVDGHQVGQDPIGRR